MATTTITSRPNPYIGPRPYQKGETIYGRERETSELADLLIAERIVLLYSPSGAGKSSLLNAAILPKMATQGFQVLPVLRVNLEPPMGVTLDEGFNRYVYSCVQSIEDGVPLEKRFPGEELVRFKFKDYLNKYRERARSDGTDDNDAPLLLVFDQAEEALRISLTDREKKMDFFAQLGDVLRDRNIWALVVIREDYLAAFDPYLRPIPTRLANRYRLNFLGPEAAMEAIQRPAKKVGVDVEDQAAAQLVDDLRAMLVQQPDGSTTQELGPTIEPVQLQVVCRRLWAELPDRKTTISLEQVKALGNVNKALADYYSLQVASVASTTHVAEREIREWCGRKLITASGLRGQVLLTPEKSDGLDNKAVWLLERAYLIRAEKRGGATWFELAHDRLVRPVLQNNGEWFEKHLNVLQRRADLWDRQGRPDSMLLVGPEFLAMERWVKEDPAALTQAEEDFYRKSQKAHQSALRERTANLVIRWLFAMSVLATLGAFWYFLKAHFAEQNAVAREVAAASVSTIQIDPERSVLLALEGLAVTTNPRPEIIQALHQALPEMRVARASSPQEGHLSRVFSVVYSPDGKTLASASKDGTVDIWDADTLSVLQTLTLVDDPDKYNGYGAFAAVYSPDGKSLAAVSADGRLTVWNTSTWQIKYQVTAHSGQARAVAYSPDGKYIATGGEDSYVRVWDIATGKKKYVLGGLTGNKYGVEALIFSQDSSTLFAGGDNDRVIYAWDMSTGDLAYQLDDLSDPRNIVNGLALSPNGKLLATAGSDRLISLWNLENRTLVMQIPGHVDWVYGLAFTPDGKTLVSASADRTIRLWDTDYGRSLMVLTGPSDQVFGVAVSPNGRYLASSSADTYVRLWDISPQGSREVMTLDHGDDVHDVIVSPDGKLIASAGRDGVIDLWQASTGTLVKKLKSGFRSAEVLSWSHDGRFLAAGYESGQAVVWDMKNYSAAVTIRGTGPTGSSDPTNSGPPIWGLSFNPDATLLAAGDEAGIVHIYDAKTGKEQTQLNADKEFKWTGSGKFTRSDLALSAALFSPNGKYLAASYGTKEIVIWDWQAGKPWLTLEGHTDIIENMDYNADGSLLASASDDGTIILWDLAPQRDATHIKTTFVGHRALVYDVAFSPDGKTLASAGGDGLVKIWDVLTGNYLFDLYGNSNSVLSVVFTPDGRHVVSGSSDHTVRVYTLDTQELIDLAEARVTRPMNEAECLTYLKMSCENFNPSDPFRPLTNLLSAYFKW